MSYGFQPQSNYPPQPSSAQNLNFYQSSYSPAPVSGHGTPAQASYGYGGPSVPAYGGASGGFNSGFGAAPVSGRMGESGGLRTGWMAAFGTEGYEGEPPLLEELDINFGHIQAKTLTVLNPLARIDQHIMDDSDLAGPLLLYFLLGTFLKIAGNSYFGYIYGLAGIGSLCLHTILALMSPPVSPNDATSSMSTHHDHTSATVSGGRFISSTLTPSRSASVLGYCLLPLVFVNLLGVVVSMDGFFGYVLTSAAIAWCTYSSSGMFCAVGRMHSMRGLVAYPVALFYVGFGIMGIFSSKGAAALGGKVA